MLASHTPVTESIGTRRPGPAQQRTEISLTHPLDQLTAVSLESKLHVHPKLSELEIMQHRARISPWPGWRAIWRLSVVMMGRGTGCL